MDVDYKLELENSRMEERLLVTENLSVLEELLYEESQKLEGLQKQKNQLNFGKKVNSKELIELFPKVSKDVDDFLGLKESSMPKFGYYNIFKPGLLTTPVLVSYGFFAVQIIFNSNEILNNNVYYFGTIFLLTETAFTHSVFRDPGYFGPLKQVNLKKTVRPRLIPTIAHEYTHHIQNEAGVEKKKCSIFMEGHARGVQKQMALNYYETEDNRAFLWDVLDETVGEFKSAYVWMCKKLGKMPKKSLLKTKTSRDMDEFLSRVFFRPTPHAIGNTLFSIYETMNGKEIYKQMIHGEYQFT